MPRVSRATRERRCQERCLGRSQSITSRVSASGVVVRQQKHMHGKHTVKAIMDLIQCEIVLMSIADDVPACEPS